jgi:CubicO group peptidase (beta-lactamase class C family)
MSAESPLPLSAAALTNARRWFEANFDQRGEIGASVSVWQDGQEVLSLIGGQTQRDAQTAWQADTLVPVWSATKAVAAVCALMVLAEKNLPLNAPVAELWPEFATAGKSAVTFGQLLSHSAGLCALDEVVSITDAASITRALEQQAPAWPPGTAHGYHARTFGFLLETLVQRGSQAASVAEFFEQRLRRPLQLDFWLGLPVSEHGRVATVYPGKMKMTDQEKPFMKAFTSRGTLTQRTFTSPIGLNAIQDFNLPTTWQAGYASMGGVASARGLAQFYALLAQGGMWAGQRWVPETVIQQLSQTLADGEDLVLLTPTAFAAGVMQDPQREGQKLRQHFGPNTRAYGHPGAGGCLGFADPETGLSFAYVMNQMEVGALPGPKSLGIIEALYGAA